MKTGYVIAIVIGLYSAILIGACATATNPGAVTSQQQVIANAVEDSLSLGLIPVLTKNVAYIDAAQAVAAGLGTFSGSTITQTDVDSVVAKTGLSAADAQTVSALVIGAWQLYQKRYSQQVGASVRPDVRLFLSAVSAGITNAISAVPK